jgi:hypothetical protein
MAVRICPECGAAFVPRYGGQACCSDECKAARRKMLDAVRYRFRDLQSESAFREERRAKARRRAEFFAARDAAFERAGLPIPKIEIRNGIIIERRGTVPAGCHAADFIRHS